MSDNTQKLEALLFIYGEPIGVAKALKLLKLSEAELNDSIEDLKACLKDSGLALMQHAGLLQLVTKGEYAPLIAELVKDELNEELSRASLETLAMVSYLGPVSRAKIDYIRGVNSSYILRHLLMRGLVIRDIDPKRPNSYLYSVSVELLRHLGVGSIDELPDVEKYKKILEQANMEQAGAV